MGIAHDEDFDSYKPAAATPVPAAPAAQAEPTRPETVATPTTGSTAATLSAPVANGPA